MEEDNDQQSQTTTINTPPESEYISQPNNSQPDEQYNEDFGDYDDIFEEPVLPRPNNIHNMNTTTSSVALPPSSSYSQQFMPSLPPTSASRTPSTPSEPTETSIQKSPNNEKSIEQQVIDVLSAFPQPSAIKSSQPSSTHAKRMVIPAARSDGLIRKSGTLAAMEKQLWEKKLNRKNRSRTNIYDRPASTSRPESANEQSPKQPVKLKRVPKEKKKKPPRKIKAKKPPRIWHPLTANERNETLASVRTGRRSKAHGLVQPYNIEALVKLQETFEERIAILSNRPLPLQDLQVLVETEVKQEELALKELGTLLHKEYLKLQLEEGVLKNMLRLSESGTLDVADLIQLRPISKWTKQDLRDMEKERMELKKHLSENTSNLQSLTEPIALESNPNTPADVQSESAMFSEGDDQEEEDDDEEDEEEEEEVEEGEDEEDDYEYDDEGELRMTGKPKYSLPSESYSSRPLASTSEGESSIGRPGASLAQPYDSLGAIKKLVGQKSKGKELKRKADVLDDYDEADNYDDDGDEVDDEEIELYISDEEEDEEEEEEEYSGSDEEYGDEYDEENESDYEGELEEDEQRDREELLTLLSKYNAGS
ncbi:hypothetical protein BGZ46_005699 [Entomortierella lignicola]|nr:hypothetical protein BGZ46_005699 [Entomortierella lignicola]